MAASGGDQVAVRDAFLKSGGAVLVQDGITRKAVAAGQNAANDAAGYAINAISPEVTAKFKAATATVQDLAQQVDKQAAAAAHWKDAAQASVTKLAFGDWNVSWDPAKLRTGADVAIVLTYVGTGRVAEIPSSIPPTPALTPYADVGATLASSGGAAANSMVKALAAAYRSAYYDFKERNSPLPDKIRQNLAPYFSAEVLDAARYAVGTVTIKVGTATLDLQEAAGPNAFMSIGELMIFRSDPTSDLVSLEWIAHALQHSMQFRNAGEYEPFAKTVLTNGTAIETEARAVQMRVHDYYATHPPTGDPLYIVGSFRFLPDGPLYSVLSDDTIAIVSAASYKIVGVRVASSIDGSLPWMIHLGNGMGPDAAVATNGDILVNLGDGGGWNSKSSSFIPHRTQLLVPRADS